MRLHGEQGIVGTSWEEIARRAGVSQATVYRHFPSLSELVPACGAMAEEFMRPPTPERAETLFEGVHALEERIARLVDELSAFYERASGSLLLARREAHLVEPLAAWADRQAAVRELLVRRALGESAPTDRTAGVVDALVSFSVWQALIEAGIPSSEARSVIRGLVLSSVSESVP